MGISLSGLVNVISFSLTFYLVMARLVYTHSSQEYNLHLLFNSFIHTDYPFITLDDGCNQRPTVVYKGWVHAQPFWQTMDVTLRFLEDFFPLP